MRTERIISLALIFGASVSAIYFWKKASGLEVQNAKLQEELAGMESTLSANAEKTKVQSGEMERLRKQTTELMTLRNEVTQLRKASSEQARVAQENQRLRTENQELKSRTAAGSAPPSPARNDRAGFAAGEYLARNGWVFAGYATPEDALVSAIAAMKDGNPTGYLESLSPEEQQRMAEAWKDKTEQEIAQKHQQDVSNIRAMKIVGREELSPTEVLMDVEVVAGGEKTVRKVKMQNDGQNWKYGGSVQVTPPPGQ